VKTLKQVKEIIVERSKDKIWPYKETSDEFMLLLEKYDENMMFDDFLSKETIPSAWAYYWSYFIGDREIMKDMIRESKWAYFWSVNFGDCEIMRDRITDPEWALYWGLLRGDKEIMRERIVK